MRLWKKMGILSFLLFLSFCSKETPQPANGSRTWLLNPPDYDQMVDDKILVSRDAFDVEVRHRCIPDDLDYYNYNAQTSDDDWDKIHMLEIAEPCIVQSYELLMDTGKIDRSTVTPKIAFFIRNSGKFLVAYEGDKIFEKDSLHLALSRYNVVYRAILIFQEIGKTEQSYIILPHFVLLKKY